MLGFYPPTYICTLTRFPIQESLLQCENRIMAQVYVRSISRSTMYQNLQFVRGTGVWKISPVAIGSSSFNIDYSDYRKSLINRINEIYRRYFSIKYRYSDILLNKHKLHLNLLFCFFAAITRVIVLTWFP